MILLGEKKISENMRSLAIGVVSVLVSMILVQESRSSPNLIALAKVEFEDCGKGGNCAL